MKCHLCGSTKRVKLTDRMFDTVPICLFCYRTNYSSYKNFWRFVYGLRGN